MKVLVIGYGNDLHGDDAVGQRVADAVAVRPWHSSRRNEVKSLAVHQLTPELASELATADLAIFVDAYISNAQQNVQVSPLERGCSWVTMGHSSDPMGLLAISEAVYGYCPQAWLVAIPGKNFELGDRLSPIAEQGMTEALVEIERLVQLTAKTY